MLCVTCLRYCSHGSAQDEGLGEAATCSKTYICRGVQVSAVFRAGKSQPVVAKNASPIAGALIWAESLRQRILGPLVRLKAVGSVATSGMLSILTDPSEKLLGAIKEFEQAILSTWCAEISVISSTKLKQPLLRCFHFVQTPIAR